VKPFTYSGVWWLPFKEDQKVAGEATFAGDKQTKLTLHGMFPHHFKPGIIDLLPWYPIILGTTDAGEPVTLFHCQETYSSSLLAEEGEEGEQEYWAEVVYIGSHFTDPEQIFFNKVDLQYSYLPQWAGIFPYYGQQKPFDEVSASTAKGTVVVQLVKSVWERFAEKTDLIPESDLPEVVRIRCEVQDALSLEEWMNQFITPLQHLISLATQRPNAIVSIVGYRKQNEANQLDRAVSETPVQIAFPPAIIPIPANKSTTPRTILFSLQEISSNFSPIIDTWLHNADELDSVYKLFFGVQYTNLLLDLRFLLIAQAVEVYQDHRFLKPALPEEEHKSLMETILAACADEKHKEWLADTLQYSNHATFRQQLRNFITQANAVLHPLLGSNSTKRSQLAEVIYNTRNYLTHHTKELIPKTAGGRELFFITRCLSLALQICLMKELGFATQHLSEIAHKHEDYGLILLLQGQVDLEKLIASH
jgi:ApeA N-terminal domain 1